MNWARRRATTVLRRTIRIFAAASVATLLTSTAAHAQVRAYVGNWGSHDVSVIDTASRTVIDTIPVGEHPSGIAFTPDGNLAYVANNASGTVSVIDTTLMAVIDTIAVVAGPEAIAITPDGAFAYVTHPGLRLLSVLHTADNTVLTTIQVAGNPRAIAVTPDSAYVYVGHDAGSPDRNLVSAISTATHALVATVTIPWFIRGLESVTISPDGALVYVTNAWFTTVYVIDTRSNLVVGFVGRPGGGSGGVGYWGTPALTPDGGSIYLPLYYPAIAVFDTGGSPSSQVIPIPSSPRVIAITPDGSSAYVTAGSAVTVIDTTTKAVTGQISAGNTPIAVAFSPPLVVQGPFGGIPRSIPGRIQAEDYDVGGQGLGYFDTTPGNEQGSPVYRPDDVDIRLPAEGDYAVGWFVAGEWLAYTADVQSDGVYTIQARIASPLPGRTFHVEVDGSDVTGQIPVPQSVDWDHFETVSIADVRLHAGRQVVRVVMGPQDYMDLQWIAFARQSTEALPGPFGGVPRVVPGRLQAEDYDAGGQGLAYFDTTADNEQGLYVYRTDDVDIKESSEGGHAIGWFASGEWLTYTVDVESDGLYTIQAHVGSPLSGRTFHIEVDGTDVTGPVAVPELAGWDQYQTVDVADVNLRAGRQVLRVVMGPEDFMDLQWIGLVQQDADAPAPFGRFR